MVRQWVHLKFVVLDFRKSKSRFELGSVLCGPAGFMASMEEILTAMGVAAAQIRRERFTAGVADSADRAHVTYTVEFAKSGRKVAALSTEPLLNIAETNGIDIPYNCRVGQCGTCATRVLDGEVEMETEEGLTPALRSKGYRLMCVGVARSNVILQA